MDSMASQPRGSRAVLVLLALAVLFLAGPADAMPKILPKMGPCSTTVGATLYFGDLQGLFARTQYPSTTTVLMYMTNNITLQNSTRAHLLILNSTFSCTIIKADPALNGAMPFFYYNGSEKGVMVVVNVTNLMFIGIGWKHEWLYELMPSCMPWNAQAWWYRPPWWMGSDGFWDNSWTCAVLTVYRSFNVMITQSTILGRLDIIRSASTDVTYSYIYVDSDFWLSINSTLLSSGYGYNFAAVLIKLCGDNVNLVRANNRIAHNYIRGSSTTVLLYWGATGNIVQNNYITGFGFSGLQCGQGMQNVADCMLNTFELNYITPDPDVTVDQDGAGIYYDTHWFNPGNRDSCNYQILGNQVARCYYVDYVSTGLLVEGGVCVMNGGLNNNNSAEGANFIKLNTGKMNVFKSVIYVNLAKRAGLGFLSCQNWCTNRCGGNREGIVWWQNFQKSYNNDLWLANYPYMSTMCTAQGYTVKGTYYSCDPKISTVPNPGSPLPECYVNMTRSNNSTGTFFSPTLENSGNCSGWPVLNDLSGVIFITNFTVTKTSSWYYSLYQMTIAGDCAPLGTTMSKLNNVPAFTKKWMPYSLGFNNEDDNDYGADDPSAPIYQTFPDFYSCPKRLAGPQTASFAASRAMKSLYSKFSKFRPGWLRKRVPKALRDARPNTLEWAKKFRRYKQLYGK